MEWIRGQHKDSDLEASESARFGDKAAAGM